MEDPINKDQKEDIAKKKDKKKKKTEKEKKDEKDKKKTGGPGKKQIAAMQDALRKIKEEEERLQREEEERIKAEDLAELQKEEKLRLEKEKKDKKKLKDKERKERLKKEGKLLTPKQKADRDRAKLSLELMKKEGRVVVGRERVKKQGSTESKSDAKSPVDEKEVSLNESAPNGTEDIDEVPSEDEVMDNWEELTEELEKVSSPSKDKSPENNNTELNGLPKTIGSNKSTKVQDAVTTIPPEPSIKKPESSNKKLLPNQDTSWDWEPHESGLRSPIICVLGHVDTGKTKLLDYIRKTHVQDNEAGGITQQIGATFVPPSAIHEQRRGVKSPIDLQLPGLLIIDTPGHESFTNLRSRGSSLCDIAILVIDIMHGLEPQTIESINLLKARKTPFVVALNKIDRLYMWESNHKRDVEDVIKSQVTNTKLEFEQRYKQVIVELNEQSLNAALFFENSDPRTFVSLVPTSAFSGDGMGNLINLIVNSTQNMMTKKLLYEPDRLEATVLEVKAIPGLGTTIDVILVNGKLEEGDKIVLAGHDGPISTHIRALLVPQALRELRVKSPYRDLKVVHGSMGVKVTATDLEKAVAGLDLYVAKNEAEIEHYKKECWDRFGKAMRAIKCKDKGVYVQASTLGSLEALLEFLKVSKIPYCGIRIGPVVKKDVMRTSVMLEAAPDMAVILAFDVKVERDAQELADHLGVKIFTAQIIYHLFDKFTAYRDELKAKKKEQFRNTAVFPCKLRILPQFIFNTRDPIVCGVSVEDGVLMVGTPICVPERESLDIGRISSIEVNHKQVESARKGQEVCIKIEHDGGDAPKLLGRHFEETDLMVSKITRDSIDIMKEYFRDDLTKPDWQLMIELKKLFQIM